MQILSSIFANNLIKREEKERKKEEKKRVVVRAIHALVCRKLLEHSAFNNGAYSQAQLRLGGGYGFLITQSKW